MPHGRSLRNPYRPGAGHMPPFLAGRLPELREFRQLLGQDTIVDNMVLTGLRGVGKTVLLETFKPVAVEQGWLWVGTDLSESSSISEGRLAERLLTDLAVASSSIVTEVQEIGLFGYQRRTRREEKRLDFSRLADIYKHTPGLVADKLKAVLLTVWKYVQDSDSRGMIFAYDEAQNLRDHSAKDEFPLSLLLETFQSIQRQGANFMLVLTGLPTLFPKLVEARTYAERMFRVVFLDRLSESDSRDAITKPVEADDCLVRFNNESIRTIIEISAGYPYFIQFMCREVFDIWAQGADAGNGIAPVPVDALIRKLDSDFFAGRWARATDRQRDLLQAIAQLPQADAEFAVQDVVEISKRVLAKPFSPSHANQMLASLCNAGLVYKNRHGRYSFAVPLLGQFILRQMGRRP